MATDGDAWATVRLEVPARTGPPSRRSHDDLLPALGGRPRASATHTRSTQALAQAAARPGVGRAAAGRRTSTWWSGSSRAGRLLPGEGHVLPAQAQPRRAHPLAARRMSAPATRDVTSTSTPRHRGPHRRGEEPAAQLTRDLDDVAAAPGRHRRAGRPRPDHAVERVDRAPRAPAGRRARTIDPELPQRVAARQHLLLAGLRQPPDQASPR